MRLVIYSIASIIGIIDTFNISSFYSEGRLHLSRLQSILMLTYYTPIHISV